MTFSEVDIEERWKIIKKIIKDNAEVVLGFRQNVVRNEWFDEEFKEKIPRDKQRKNKNATEENKIKCGRV
jgi:hypothetical protein